MTAKKKRESSASSSLRIKAEKPVPRHPPKTKKIFPRDAEKLVSHLEAQNQELREKQQKIEEARRRYLDLYDFAPIGYFVFDQKGRIVDLNQMGARMLGRPRNQIIGAPFVFFVTKEFMHPFNRHLEKVFSGTTKETCELKISQRYQKSVVYVSVESMALNTDKGTTCQSAVIDITERKLAEKEVLEARQELSQRNAQLRRLSARLFETHEEERSRFAEAVHDSFSSQLCVIKSRLQSLLGNVEDDRLKDVFNLLDIAIEDARRIQKDLWPPVLDDLGLIPALDMLCREFQNSHRRIRVEKQFLLMEGKIPDSVKVPIYRIAEEGLENIATYSGADSVNISLTRQDSFIQFVIRDNGRGFDPEEMFASGTGRGLLTMRQRALLSGGLFDIESLAGKGTILRASWPFA